MDTMPAEKMLDGYEPPGYVVVLRARVDATHAFCLQHSEKISDRCLVLKG